MSGAWCWVCDDTGFVTQFVGADAAGCRGRFGVACSCASGDQRLQDRTDCREEIRQKREREAKGARNLRKRIRKGRKKASRLRKGERQ